MSNLDEILELLAIAAITLFAGLAILCKLGGAA